MTNLTKHYYVSRPHAPGEIAAALVGRRLTSANRIGKMLWFETDDGDGPDLGIHLGMAGRIAIDEDVNDRWDRFALTFDDGGRVALRDKRRLGRAVLEPEIESSDPMPRSRPVRSSVAGWATAALRSKRASWIKA